MFCEEKKHVRSTYFRLRPRSFSLKFPKGCNKIFYRKIPPPPDRPGLRLVRVRVALRIRLRFRFRIECAGMDRGRFKIRVKGLGPGLVYD